jgi:hypothetical protein
MAVMNKQGPAPISTPVISRLSWLLFFSTVGWLIYRGWALRTEHYLTAEKGVGYMLGIIGGVMMLTLLLYPLRKNLRLMRHWGPISVWFRMHMLFGVLGPALILFHSNFNLGSLNSSVALFCMLLVASSGIVGRFFYTRIHYGLYGRKANLQELADIVNYNKGQLSWLNDISEEMAPHLQAIEQLALKPVAGLFHSLGRWVRHLATGGWHSWQLRRLTNRALLSVTKNEQWDKKQRRTQHKLAHAYLNNYFEASRKVLELNFYERMFALWHVIHFPFFLMMVLSGVIHVVAVHMY